MLGRLIIFLLLAQHLSCTVEIHNLTDEDLFATAASYESDVVQSYRIYSIAQGDEIKIEDADCGTQIFVHKDKIFLEKQSFDFLLQNCAHIQAAKKLYICKQDTEIIICPTKNPFSYVNEHILYKLNHFNEKNLDYIHRFCSNHQYSDMDAKVRIGTDLCTEEKEYLYKRKAYIQKHAEKFLGTSTHVPTIALCFSGGGYRAMLATVGFLIAAEETGLLDMVCYSASLSGSTWAIGLLHSLKKAPKDLKEYLKEHVQRDLFKSKITVNALSALLYKKIAFGRKVSLIDFYGGLLSQRLLDHSVEPASLFLHAQTNSLSEGALPYPIYTSVMIKPDHSYAWMEFTPHEIGSDYLGAFVPAWALGRAFYNGVSTTRTEAEKLGFLYGVWGSAFSANLKEIYVHTKNDLKSSYLTRTLGLVAKSDSLNKIRLASTKVRNFTQGMPHSALSNKQYLTFLDAGLDFNLPFPPLLRPERSVDIIIVVDASACNPGEQLVAAEQYAKRNSRPFPSTAESLANSCTILKGNETTPTIIYMPLVKNNCFDDTFDPQESCKNGYCRTSNFAYKPEEVDQITGLMSCSLKANFHLIKNALLKNN